MSSSFQFNRAELTHHRKEARKLILLYGLRSERKWFVRKLFKIENMNHSHRHDFWRHGNFLMRFILVI